MGTDYDYDVAVIGAGPGGYVAAIRAAQLGASACVIEKGPLGGVCTNVGCIPTKVIWHSARMLLRLREAETLGLKPARVDFDFARLASRRDEVTATLRKGIQSLLSANDVELIRATASFADPHTLECRADDGERELSADKVIVATGSSSVELEAAPFDADGVWDSSDAVNAEHVPESIVVVGGGYIGCEFASIYAAFGAEVTLVEMMDRLLPGIEPDCARELTRSLRKMDVAIHTGTTLEGVERAGGGVQVRLSGGETVTAEKCLVCVGRRPDAGGLALENAGLETGENGQIPVNEHMQTNQPSIYAVGDVTGGPLLAHVASQEGLVAAAHATGSLSAAMDYSVLPACVFVFPEIATVGLTREEAAEQGEQVVVVKFPFRALGKAHVVGETGGFVKMIAREETGQLLGVHICAAEASSLLGEACVALRIECTARELAETIHAHPTLPESLREAAEGIIGLPINWRG